MPRYLSAAIAAMCALTLTSGPAAADDVVPAPVFTDAQTASHFYRFNTRTVQLSTPVRWVASGPDGLVLAMRGETGSLLGSTDLMYAVTSWDLVANSERPLGTLDVAPIVGAGSSVRVVDFVYIPQLQSGSTTTARVMLSIASFDPVSGCRRLHVSEVVLDLTGAGNNRVGRAWFTLPCVDVVADGSTGGEGPVLHQSGGRVVLVPRRDWTGKAPELYVTVGDFQVLASKADSLKPGARRLLSTVLRVKRSGEVIRWATGLRNPQGLATVSLDGKPALVATSHGPRGGDELIRIRRGADYGWPRESYGTVYNTGAAQHRPGLEGALPTAELPAFSWVPSIGPGPVLQITGPAFRRWWGATKDRATADLLVVGMGSQQFYRVRWQGGAVRYVEVIPTGGNRVRSMSATPSGSIIAGTDTGRLLVITPVATWSTAGHRYVPIP